MTERSSSSTLRGILWMIVTGLMFVGVTSLVKYLGPDMPAAEAAFLRYALGLVLLVPMLWSVFKSDFSQPNINFVACMFFRGFPRILQKPDPQADPKADSQEEFQGHEKRDIEENL